MGEPSDEEMERPMMWRFWRALPPKGKIGVFLGSWYTWPILNRARGLINSAELVQSLERAKRLEKMLADEGALLIKFWLHLSKDKQEKRLKLLENNPKTRWRVTKRDWDNYKRYDKFVTIHETVIRHTSTAEAPWIVVEGADVRYRSLTVGKVILESLRKRLAEVDKPKELAIRAAPLLPPIDKLSILKTLDLSQKLDKKKFASSLEKYQGKLALLTRDPRFKEITVIAVFEGNDAAGKGGSIRRITGAAVSGCAYRRTD
jgi:polyphosphate kinase 2 (PPK2 family)